MFIDQQVIIKKISNIDEKEKALVRAFSCGKDHIDSYLKDEALEDVIYGITKTFLLFITSEDSPTFLLGFFSLTTDRGVVTKKSTLTGKFKEWKNPISRDSIPGIQIHHFGVQKEYQRQHFGTEMMFYVFTYIQTAILPHIGACLITVQSEKDVKNFYESIGFRCTGQDRGKNVSMAFLTNEFFIDE